MARNYKRSSKDGIIPSIIATGVIIFVLASRYNLITQPKEGTVVERQATEESNQTDFDNPQDTEDQNNNDFGDFYGDTEYSKEEFERLLAEATGAESVAIHNDMEALYLIRRKPVWENGEEIGYTKEFIIQDASGERVLLVKGYTTTNQIDTSCLYVAGADNVVYCMIDTETRIEATKKMSRDAFFEDLGVFPEFRENFAGTTDDDEYETQVSFCDPYAYYTQTVRHDLDLNGQPTQYDHEYNCYGGLYYGVKWNKDGLPITTYGMYSSNNQLTLNNN